MHRRKARKLYIKPYKKKGNPNAKVFEVGCKLRQNTYCCLTGVVSTSLANNFIYDTLLIYICSGNSQLMKCMHASPCIYVMHMADRQEYGAISLSTYSDNMDLGYDVPVV